MSALSSSLAGDHAANLAEKPSVLGAGFVADLADQPVEGGFDPTFGNVTWQTLISGDLTASNGLVPWRCQLSSSRDAASAPAYAARVLFLPRRVGCGDVGRR